MEVRLLSSDQSPIAKSLATLLPACGVYVHEEAVAYRPDAIVCVCSKPEKSIANVCAEAKKGGPPVFVLAANGSGLDQVNCLRIGAYRAYVGPFSIPRLVHDLATISPHEHSVQKGKLTCTQTTAQWAEISLVLSRKQALALYLLTSRPVLTRIALAEALSAGGDISLPATDALIARLRKKLPAELAAAIHAVYGIGFKLLLQEQLE